MTFEFSGTFFEGFPIEYDYYDGCLSVTWESDTTAIARVHNPASLPEDCDYYGTCFLRVYEGGNCEIKALYKDPGLRVHRHMRRYLQSLQLKGFYRRLKQGKIVTVWYK